MEVGHLLSQLLLKLLDDRTSQDLLGGETKDVSEERKQEALTDPQRFHFHTTVFHLKFKPTYRSTSTGVF